MLTPDTEAPRVPQTTVRPDLLQPLEIVTELRVNTVGQNLRVLAVDDIPLPVQEPCWDLELRGVLNDGHEPLELIGVQLAGTGELQRKERQAELRNPGEDKAYRARRNSAYRLLRSTSAFLQTKLE